MYSYIFIRVATIDAINIREATLWLVENIEKLPEPVHTFIDGKISRNSVGAEAIIGGDAKVLKLWHLVAGIRTNS